MTFGLSSSLDVSESTSSLEQVRVALSCSDKFGLTLSQRSDSRIGV